MGFEPQIRRIVQQRDMPPPDRRTGTLLFSATFPPEIQKLAGEFMRDYVWIAVGRVGSTVDSIEQRLFLARGGGGRKDDTKLRLLAQCLEAVPGRTLVFCKMKREAHWLSRALQRGQAPLRARTDARAIHGDLTQPEREKNLDAFRSGRARVLVATDVASRGLDIPDVAHVVNYSLPDEFDSYVHRIGRTGRAGNTGVASAFYVPGAGHKWGNGRIAAQLLHLLRENDQARRPREY